MEENIAQYVNFAKLVPGFKALNPKDVSRLLKGLYFYTCLIYIFLDSAIYLNDLCQVLR
jgi:hypothetical protein